MNCWIIGEFLEMRTYPCWKSHKGLLKIFHCALGLLRKKYPKWDLKGSFGQAFIPSILSSILNKNVLFWFKVKFTYLQNILVQFWAQYWGMGKPAFNIEIHLLCSIFIEFYKRDSMEKGQVVTRISAITKLAHPCFFTTQPK